MPKFYFQVDDGNSLTDDVGWELKDLATAKCKAVRVAGQMICDAEETFWNCDDWRMTVTDEVGLTLFTLEMVGTVAPAFRGEKPLSTPHPR